MACFSIISQRVAFLILILPVAGLHALAAEKPRVLVTISKETTYITEPLRADGYPDYVAALNQHCSEGVTPENNSAVLFWRAIGPSEIAEQDREKYFQMLGIPPLPEKGDYFITSDTWVERQQAKGNPDAKEPEECYRDPLWEQQSQITSRPWSREEFPVWAEWLEVNEKPLALLVEASKCPRRYDPMLGGIVIAVLLPAIHQHRDVAKALVARAMLRLQEGKIDEAWEDLLACHRFGRLVGQGATLIDVLVGIAIDKMAFQGDRALLHYAQLSKAAVAKMRDDIAKLPPMPKFVNKIDVAERYTYLDIVLMIARNRRNYASELTAGWNPQGLIGTIIDRVPAAAIDWNLILRIGNSWYDRTAEAVGKSPRTERQKAVSEITEDLQKLEKSTKGFASFSLLMLGNPRQAVSERLSHIFVTLFLPATNACVIAEDRAIMQVEFTKLAFALAAYRAEQGSYPTKLADLVPKYIAKVPKDIFNDAEPHYRQEGNGYLLYSVGDNGKDDGGKGLENERRGDDFMEKAWDDLVVRMPAVE